MSFKNVVVLGGGVTGLTTGITLLQNGAQHVIITAKHLPGDITSEYTSHWAGACILSFASSNDKRLQDIDRYTLKEFHRLATHVPEAGVSYCPGYQYFKAEDQFGEDNYWVRDLYQEYEKLSKEELPKDCVGGYRFVSFTANVPQYLGWLVTKFQSLGGKIERNSFDSLQSVIDHYKECDTLINCTGLGSYYLKDVQDHTMYPVRGQTIVVRAPHVKWQLYEDVGPNEKFCTYIIPRGDGTVICGGTMDTENKNIQPEPELTKKILNNCYQLFPYITHGNGPDAFDIVSVNVGFRPGRKDGIRLEKEIKNRSNGEKVQIVHNYGHSSHGYQSSWGSSEVVVRLLKDHRFSKL
ncbi:unnamed protein product [Cunninghamella echinulata]